ADHLANGWEVTIVPTQRGAVVHRQALGLSDRTLGVGLLAPAVIRAALRLLIRRPRAVLSTFFLILSRTRSPKLLLRNLAVFAKGLWLAEEAARRDVEHIHVHWIAVPATM